MMFGLPENTLEAIRRALGECAGLEKVVIYGSRAKGTFRPGSDIDLALYGNVSDADLSALMDRLDALNTPYLFDLVRYHDIDNEALRDHIARVGQRFDTP
ncbi:type I restriction enzyme, R subunit [Chromohalobacter canadensis]|uniref:Type I restriction enzyme, R subunit n=1 Tax=Chromohalobacter canadensis TaxID=141389 RepID=A0A285VG05_9GAMM|nr:nucleotidyltransferase domain-containing protein [Chromohalobacter canadensis]SOC52893.1 type I restriction enzyme, R subunit [Chromohalobacter canadensis]